MARLLACSDFQLGAGRTVALTLADQEAVLSRIVELAEEQRVDLCLFLGDAFENRQTNRDQDEVFMRWLVEMQRVCPVLALLGNHCWRGYERASTIGIFREIGVTVVSTPGVHRYGDVAIACLPHASTGYLLASNGGGDRANANAEAATHLVSIAEGLRGQIEPGTPAILAGHWAVTGASLPTGLPVEQLAEPVIEIADLAAQRWDAIALGHIHRAQLIDAAVPAFYCGSPFPCDWGESDDEHGVWLLEPDPATGNERERAMLVPRFVPLESRPLVKIGVEATDLVVDGRTALLPLETGGGGNLVGAVVRLTVSATQEQASRLDVAQVKRDLYALGAHHVAAVNVEVERVERARVEGLTEELSEIEALDVWMGAQGVNGAKADALRERTERYVEAVRS